MNKSRLRSLGWNSSHSKRSSTLRMWEIYFLRHTQNKRRGSETKLMRNAMPLTTQFLLLLSLFHSHGCKFISTEYRSEFDSSSLLWWHELWLFVFKQYMQRHQNDSQHRWHFCGELARRGESKAIDWLKLTCISIKHITSSSSVYMQKRDYTKSKKNIFIFMLSLMPSTQSIQT